MLQVHTSQSPHSWEVLAVCKEAARHALLHWKTKCTLSVDSQEEKTAQTLNQHKLLLAIFNHSFMHM